MSIIRGSREELVMPNKLNPTNRGRPEVVTDTKSATATNKARRARDRPLKCGGTNLGMTKTAGIAAMRGIEAANPAVVGDMPPLSRILGSQLVKPCRIANDKGPIMRIIRMFRTLTSLLKTLLILPPSVASVGLISLAKNHHNDAIAKVRKP
jgi:hypothetical protein